MSEIEIPSSLIEKLITFGVSEDFEGLKAFLESSTDDWIMRVHPRRWEPIKESLSKEDLKGLIKSLTIAEQIGRWKAGSVSPVIELFSAFRWEPPEVVRELATWIIENRVNEYIPWGTMHYYVSEARTFGEAIDGSNAYSASKAASARLYEEEQAKIQEEKRKKLSEKATWSIYNAIRRGDTKAVKALLEKEPDPESTIKDGQSWVALGLESENENIQELVKEYVEKNKP